MTDPVGAQWRVGRKVGRTIYAQVADEPDDGDALIGVMDTRELAGAAVAGHNALLYIGRRGSGEDIDPPGSGPLGF